MSERGGSTLGWLECTRCRVAHDAEARVGLCRCGGVLFARYSFENAARSLTRETVARRAPSLWRYAELLPPSEAPVTLGEGMTPLLPLVFLAPSIGVASLLVKDEALNPTGSFKARGMAAALTAARRRGFRRAALPSAGNAGSAAAAYGALAGVAIEVFLPVDTPEPFRLEAAVYGATVHLVDGDIAACGRAMRETMEGDDWLDLSTMREPWRVEGKKIIGFEIAEQLSWEFPDVVLFPTGGGTGIIGMWKAVEELEGVRLVEGAKRPRLVAVQAERCAPIVEAFEAGAERASPWPNPSTYASGLRVPAPYADDLILAALRESGGTVVAVTDEEMAAAQLEMARGEGLFVAPEGGATLAAARRLAAVGWIRPDERVVLVNTGTGLKYPRIPGLRVP